MTVVNVYLFQDRAIVWTDGTSYDDDGVVQGFVNKAHPLPHLNAILAIRGPTALLPLIAARLGEAVGSFDALAASFAPLLDDAMAFLRGAFGRDVREEEWQAFLVGLSPASGCFEAYTVTSDEPGLVTKRDAVTFCPADGIAERIGAEVPNLYYGPLVTAEVGLRVMEMQRELRINGRGGVGGFAQATIVSAAGIQTIIAKRWPDEIGDILGGPPRLR